MVGRDVTAFVRAEAFAIAAVLPALVPVHAPAYADALPLAAMSAVLVPGAAVNLYVARTRYRGDDLPTVVERGRDFPTEPVVSRLTVLLRRRLTALDDLDEDRVRDAVSQAVFLLVVPALLLGTAFLTQEGNAVPLSHVQSILLGAGSFVLALASLERAGYEYRALKDDPDPETNISAILTQALGFCFVAAGFTVTYYVVIFENPTVRLPRGGVAESTIALVLLALLLVVTGIGGVARVLALSTYVVVGTLVVGALLAAGASWVGAASLLVVVVGLLGLLV